MFKTIAFMMLMLVACCCRAQSPPSIVIIMSDDQRYDSPAMCQPLLMSRLASDGLRMTNAHCVNSSCTPSRIALITGMYPHNNGIFDSNAPYTAAIPLEPFMLQTQLKQIGYRTGFIGKWMNNSAFANPGPEPYHVSGFDWFRALDKTSTQFYTDWKVTSYMDGVNGPLVRYTTQASLLASQPSNAGPTRGTLCAWQPWQLVRTSPGLTWCQVFP